MSSKEDFFYLGVKALIRNREGKFLLLEKQRHSIETYWDIPGGRLQKGETELEALEREIEEEIGLKEMKEVTPLSMHLTNIRISTPEGDAGLIFSIYKCDILHDFTPQLSKEHIHFGWFNVFEATQLLEFQLPTELINHLKQLFSEPKYETIP